VLCIAVAKSVKSNESRGQLERLQSAVCLGFLTMNNRQMVWFGRRFTIDRCDLAKVDPLNIKLPITSRRSGQQGNKASRCGDGKPNCHTQMKKKAWARECNDWASGVPPDAPVLYA
jgi:hypothetical protein